MRENNLFFCNLENHNFVEKTIRKIHLNNNLVLTDQKAILEEVQRFYTKLFQKKGQSEETTTSLPKIPTDKIVHDHDLGKEMMIEELGEALKNSKNNKSPGIDGFPYEFFKVFL